MTLASADLKLIWPLGMTMIEIRIKTGICRKNTFEKVASRMAGIWAYRTHMSVHDFNSLWPSDTIWRHGSMSALAQIMAWCLAGPSHYLNQWSLLINEVLWHLLESNFTVSAQTTNLYNMFEKSASKIATTFPRGQWLKCPWCQP